MLDGEKALRSEVARRKADVDRHLAQAQARSDSVAAAVLQAEQSTINAQLQKHSNQVQALMAEHTSLLRSATRKCQSVQNHSWQPSSCNLSACKVF